MTFDPTSVEVTCVTLRKDHCVQVPWKYIKYVDTVILLAKTWTKGHWPLDDLWPHICWGHMCDSTQGIIVSKYHWNTSMYVDTVINFANYHIHTPYYILRTTYRMSDHIVSFWTQFSKHKNCFLHSRSLRLCISSVWFLSSSYSSSSSSSVNTSKSYISDMTWPILTRLGHKYRLTIPFMSHDQIRVKGHVGVTGVKKVIFTKNATPPTNYVAWSCDSCMW